MTRSRCAARAVAVCSRCARKCSEPSSVRSALRARAAYFLCLPKKVGKESRDRTRPAVGSPSLLARASAGHARNSPDLRLRRDHGLRDTRLANCPAPALRRCGVLERHQRRRPLATDRDGVSMPSKPPSNAGWAGAVGHRLSEARGSARSAEIARVSMAAGPSEQRRAPPQAAASWARLSLVTFFGKTKKVTGRAALKRDRGRKSTCRAAPLSARLRGKREAC